MASNALRNPQSPQQQALGGKDQAVLGQTRGGSEVGGRSSGSGSGKLINAIVTGMVKNGGTQNTTNAVGGKKVSNGKRTAGVPTRKGR